MTPLNYNIVETPSVLKLESRGRSMSSSSLYARQHQRQAPGPNNLLGIVRRIVETFRIATEVLDEAQNMRRDAARNHLFFE